MGKSVVCWISFGLAFYRPAGQEVAWVGLGEDPNGQESALNTDKAQKAERVRFSPSPLLGRHPNGQEFAWKANKAARLSRFDSGVFRRFSGLCLSPSLRKHLNANL